MKRWSWLNQKKKKVNRRIKSVMVMNCFCLYHIDSIFISVTMSFLLPTSRHTHRVLPPSLFAFFLSGHQFVSISRTCNLPKTSPTRRTKK